MRQGRGLTLVKVIYSLPWQKIPMSINERPIPWFSWDDVLERFGKWLLVGSMIAASLPAIPGLLGCITLLVIFASEKQNQAHPLIRRYNELRKKRWRTEEEESEFKAYVRWNKKHRRRPSAKAGILGYIFWILVVIYLIGIKGFARNQWL
jgi:hypothetical protein